MGVIGTKQRLFIRTQSEFDALPAGQKIDGALYFVSDRPEIYQYLNGAMAKYTGMLIESERPAAPIPYKQYLITSTYALETYINGTWYTLSGNLALGETDTTAYRGDRGKVAYDHSQADGNPHGTTFAQLGSKPTTLAGYGITDALAASLKGAANGLAELDSGGKVPSSQLPSYVDDVLEYATLTAFPATGETGKIYIAQDTNKTYRWSGTAYAEISSSLALGETSATAYRGDRGKLAYDHSQTAGNPHGTTLANMGESYASINFWEKSGTQVAYIGGEVKTNYLNQNVGSIFVGGDFNTYYPTRWRPTDGNAKCRSVRLFRNSVHTDGTNRGIYSCELSYHTSVWGNFPTLQYEQSRSYYHINPFVAKFADGSTANVTPELIIWLRGNSTHFFEYINSNGSWYCVDANASGTSITDVSGVTHSPTTAVDTELVNCLYSPVMRSIAFAKIGGTASQFLKADGSVDASTYISQETDTLHSVAVRGASTSCQLDSTYGISVSAIGINGIFVGTGDGASYSVYNAKLVGWNGIALENPTIGGAFPSQTVGYIDFRNGIINLKGGYKINGGTSSQFLKADGTVDGNSYLSYLLKGAANGLAELDSGGKVPSSQLPSYVDDVLEYATLGNFPATGESGKIYIAQDSNVTYRWSGSAYAEISSSLALGETSATAYRGDRGKIAYDHSQATGNPHGTTFAQLSTKPTTLDGYGITNAVRTDAFETNSFYGDYLIFRKTSNIPSAGYTYDYIAFNPSTNKFYFNHYSVDGQPQNTSATAGIVAASFAKQSGTASQFLKADGSVDSNSYANKLAGSVASASAITPTGTAAENEYYVTALATNLTINAPSGTPANGNNILIRIQDNGTVRTITWNAAYRSVGASLPTTTVASKAMYIGIIYNLTASKWDVVSYVQQ